MKSFRTLAAIAALGLLAACAKKDGAGGSSDVQLDTDAQKFGYAIGVDLGKSLTPVKDQVDIEALKAGLEDQFQRGESKMDDAAREAIKTTVAKAMQEKQAQERAEKAAKAKEEGDKFLAENGKREGVKTTASGLQYEVLSDAQGAKPKATDKVTVHYKGTLIDGTEFDSSYSRNQPVTFPLANVIPGWTEGLQLMPVGAKYKFYIPSSLGYGERGAGVKIGPNATLIFEVELLAIAKDEAPKAAKKDDGHGH